MEKLTNFHLPVDLGDFPKVFSEEVMYYLYYPLKDNEHKYWGVKDERLLFARDLIEAVRRDEPERFANEYVYITVKKMFVGGGVTANRPGWHCDGFLSDDLNYVWYDSVPTVFVEGKFSITPDHKTSLDEFADQAENWYKATGIGAYQHHVFPVKHLLKLDDRVIHKVNTDVPEQLMRTFVKITISKQRFNLKDNSRNVLFPLKGPLFERAMVRNDPHQAQQDYYKPVVDDHFV